MLLTRCHFLFNSYSKCSLCFKIVGMAKLVLDKVTPNAGVQVGTCIRI